MEELIYQKIDDTLNTAVKQGYSQNTIAKTISDMFDFLSHILETGGQRGWSKNLVGDSWESFEQKPYVQSFVKHLLQLQKTDQTSASAPLQQHGGAEGSAEGSTEGQASPEFSIDDMYNKARQRINEINHSSQQFARNYGTLKWVENYNRSMTEYRPFASAESLGPVGATVSAISIPPRTIMFLSGIALDTARILSSLPGSDDHPALRKSLSIVTALNELFSGNWKHALLSFIGYFGRYQMYAGIFGKVFLNIFDLVSPELQESIVKGSFTTAKSIMIGCILKSIQIFTPAPFRASFIEALDKLDGKITRVDSAIKSASGSEGEGEGESSSEYFPRPSFDDIQKLQSLVSNKSIVCSTDFQNLITLARKHSIIRFLFELCNIPVSDKRYREICGTNVPTQSIPELIAENIQSNSNSSPPSVSSAPPSAPPSALPPSVPSAPPSEGGIQVSPPAPLRPKTNNESSPDVSSKPPSAPLPATTSSVPQSSSLSQVSAPVPAPAQSGGSFAVQHQQDHEQNEDIQQEIPRNILSARQNSAKELFGSSRSRSAKKQRSPVGGKSRNNRIRVRKSRIRPRK